MLASTRCRRTLPPPTPPPALEPRNSTACPTLHASRGIPNRMRIGHFSDVHLLSLKGTSWTRFLSKRWIGGLNLLSSRARHHKAEIFDAMVEDFNGARIDHLVATGDITNVALESEFAFAREKFDKIALGSRDVTVIPGNHDAYVEEGREHFEAIFADYFASDQEWHSPSEAWPAVRVRGDLAVIGLSTSLQTPWFTCYGVLGDDQLSRLEAILSDTRLANKFRLVAIHHPPAGPRAEQKKRGLRDHQEFASVIQRAGAELILHGHEHEDVDNELAGPTGPIAVRCIQSGTYEAGNHERRARYRVYEIGGADNRPKILGESVRVWRPSDGLFVDDDGHAPPEPAQVAEPA